MRYSPLNKSYIPITFYTYNICVLPITQGGYVKSQLGVMIDWITLGVLSYHVGKYYLAHVLNTDIPNVFKATILCKYHNNGIRSTVKLIFCPVQKAPGFTPPHNHWSSLIIEHIYCMVCMPITHKILQITWIITLVTVVNSLLHYLMRIVFVWLSCQINDQPWRHYYSPIA